MVLEGELVLDAVCTNEARATALAGAAAGAALGANVAVAGDPSTDFSLLGHA